MTRIFLSALSSMVFLASASAETLKNTLPHISVTGEASEDALPDRAILLLDIVTERPTAAEAVTENAQKARSVVDEFVRQGIQGANIRNQGSTLASVASEDSSPRGAHGKRVSHGFRARNELSVIVNSLDKAESLVPWVIDTGTNEIRGVEFVVSDETVRLERLRIAALENAQQRAKSYVDALGSKLGRIVEIDHEEMRSSREANIQSKAPQPASEAIDLPLRPGAQRLKVTVSVTWTLLR